MSKAEIISLLALLISIISLLTSAHFGWRDRGRLKTFCNFYPASEYGRAKIVVVIINTGRRPINLRLLGGTDRNGHWSGQFFGDYKEDFFLKEHGRHEVTMNIADLESFGDEDILEYVDLWIEDSLGSKYIVKNSLENIEKMRAEA